jgi:hypothetical protein
VIEPGHDAWVVGDEAVVGFEFDSRTAEEYAKGSRRGTLTDRSWGQMPRFTNPLRAAQAAPAEFA